MVPEYIRCIRKCDNDWGTNIINRIYKVTGETSSDYLIEYLGTKCPSVDKSRFVSATKEEYERQFSKQQIEPQYEIY